MANPTFLVEDGTGLENSTSYVSVSFADTYSDTYFSAADFATWDALTDAVKERFLNQSTLYIDITYIFNGTRATAAQALEFPRDNLYNVEEVAVEDIPIALKQAVCLIVKRYMNSVDMNPDLERGGAISRERVDVIDISYMDSASGHTKYVEIDNLLRMSGLITANRNSIINVRLIQS